MRTMLPAILVVVCGLCSGCVNSTKESYSDGKVVVLYHDTLNLVNVHASSGYFEIQVLGKSFDYVRGWKPFYLQIPGKNWILFVTESGPENRRLATVHLADFDRKVINDIPAFDSSIGQNIRIPEPKIFETVEHFDGRNLVVLTEFLDRRLLYYIDLEMGKFVKEEVIWDLSKPQEVKVYLEGKRR